MNSEDILPDLESQQGRLFQIVADGAAKRRHVFRFMFAKRNDMRRIALAHLVDSEPHIVPKAIRDAVHDSVIDQREYRKMFAIGIRGAKPQQGGFLKKLLKQSQED